MLFRSDWGIDLDYSDIEWFALETNRDHSVVFEIASKYCISDSFHREPLIVCMKLIENIAILNDYSPRLEFLFSPPVSASPFCMLACFWGMQTHFNVSPSQTCLVVEHATIFLPLSPCSEVVCVLHVGLKLSL